MHLAPNIAVVIPFSKKLDSADMRFAALGLPIVHDLAPGFDFYIHVDDGIYVTSSDPSLGGKFQLDFVHGKVGYRSRSQEGKRQPIARAVGLHRYHSLKIADVTAGMGRDAFVLARLGADVTLVERSPVLALLLEDALQRAVSVEECASAIARMHLHNQDAKSWLQSLEQSEWPDVIYMDPMYPGRTKSALVKKEMRFISALVGKDEDAGELLELALDNVTRRVVVKRPKGAPALGARNPSHIIESPNTRYDVYVVG